MAPWQTSRSVFCGVQITQIVESQCITLPLQNAYLQKYHFHVDTERHRAKPIENRDVVYFVSEGVPRLKAIGARFPPARGSPISADCAASDESWTGQVERSLSWWPTQLLRLPYADWG